MTLPNLEAEPASAAGGSTAEAAPSPTPLDCPLCTFKGRSEMSIRIHFAKAHKGHQAPTWTDRPRRIDSAPPPPPPDPAVERPAAPTLAPEDLKKLQVRLEAAIKTAGGYAFLFGLQTTGVVISNRARRASLQTLVYAQQNEAVMRAVMAFITAMEAGEVIELTTHVAMGVGVDLGVLHPAKRVRMGPVRVPGFVFLQPIAADIQQVASIHAQADQLEQEFAAQQAANGRAGDAAGAT